MHRLRLLLVSALLVTGCAADDQPAALGRADPLAAVASPTTTSTASSGSPTTTATVGGDTTTAPDPAEADTPTPTPAPDTTVAAVSQGATSDSPEGDESATPTPSTPPDAETAPSEEETVTPTATPVSTPQEAPNPTDTPAAVNPPAIDGFAVFNDATCAVCHGVGGSGADLTESTLGQAEVVAVIRFGTAGTDMEGWDFEPKPPGLTLAEIEAVAAYVMGLRDS